MSLTLGIKIRAARTLLEWNQDDLADRAGITKQTLLKIEKDAGNHSAQIVQDIERALSSNGAFITKHGAEVKTIYQTELEGDNWFMDLLDDIQIHTSPLSNKELLIDGADDSKSPEHVIEKYRALRASGINMRQLIKEGNTYLLGDLNEYRYIPEMFYMNLLMVTYGDRVAIERGDMSGCTIYNDASLAERQRKKFDAQWWKAESPTATTATERF